MADEIRVIRVCDAELFGIDPESAEYSYKVTSEDTIEVPVAAESEYSHG